MNSRFPNWYFLSSLAILPFLFHFSLSYDYHPQNQQLFLFDEHFNRDNPSSRHGGEESETEYFDLSYVYDDNTLFFPGQRFDFELYKDIGPTINRTRDGNYKYSYASYSFCMSEHGGTHIDAPFHFNRYGWRLNEIPLKRLVDVPAVVVDVEHQVFSLRNPDTFLLKMKHINEHESQFGKIPKGAVVLFRFGWGEKFWNDHLRYSGWDNTTVRAGQTPRLNFPGISNNVAKWLVEERGIVGVGTDTLSPELGAALQSVRLLPF